jgi:hypothetical protein
MLSNSCGSSPFVDLVAGVVVSWSSLEGGRYLRADFRRGPVASEGFLFRGAIIETGKAVHREKRAADQ